MQQRLMFHPLEPLQRLHVHATEYAPLLVLAGMVLAGYGRLMMINPPLALAALLLLATAMWHASLPQATRLSAGRLAFTGFMLFIVTSIVFSGVADAQSSGSTLGAMATSLKNDMGSMFNLVVYGFYGGGLVSTGIGVNNGIKKSKGDQQVTTGHVLGYGLGGPALGMVGLVMDNAAGSLGGSSSNIGALPAAATTN